MAKWDKWEEVKGMRNGCSRDGRIQFITSVDND